MTDISLSGGRKLVYRHRLVVRLTHWIGAFAMIGLFMSGLQIFNAHPALYWGAKSDFDHPLLSMDADKDDDGQVYGSTTVFGHDFDTTGVLGLSRNGGGQMVERGFPKWITLPSASPELSMGRRLHFFFAWIMVIAGLVYLVSSLVNRHLQRDLVPTRHDLGQIPQDIWDHVRFRFPKGEGARKYNVLQKMAYLSVVAVVVPLMVLAGLAMSPTMDAGYPFLLHMFDGRQSARTVHFVIAFSLLAFFLLHIFMVIVSGLLNNLRSMITGWSSIEEDRNP